jgi:hypothetical protein
MYNTIEQSLNTKKVNIISVKNVEINGNTPKMISVQKANGKKSFLVVQYENGLYSSAS